MSAHNGEGHGQQIAPEQLTAYALGQLRDDEIAFVKAALASARGEHQQEVEGIRALAIGLSAARNAEPLPRPSPELRQRIEQRLSDNISHLPVSDDVIVAERQSANWKRKAVRYAVLASACAVALALVLTPLYLNRLGSSRPSQISASFRGVTSDEAQRRESRPSETRSVGKHGGESSASEPLPLVMQPVWESRLPAPPDPAESFSSSHRSDAKARGGVNQALTGSHQPPAGDVPSAASIASHRPFPSPAMPDAYAGGYGGDGSGYGGGYGAAYGSNYGGASGYGSSIASGYGNSPSPNQLAATGQRRSAASGYGDAGRLPDAKTWQSLSDGRRKYAANDLSGQPRRGESLQLGVTPRIIVQEEEELLRSPHGNEQYAQIVENAFLAPLDQPLSTFSIDVDTAAYANVRRFLTEGRLPPPDAVRIEELVNYFRYDYPQPKGDDPFSVNMEVTECPWQSQHLLLRVGLKGKEINRGERPASNLVFLLDVSGSMSDANKLPLLKTAMQMLVGELGENDRVSIVTYASDAGLRLPPTRGHEQEKIKSVIESLSAGGSTHGSAGIQLAYEQAAAYFVKGGANRVILCTDGDLNVGITDDDALVKLIKEKATGGTFLTVLGFGEGNLKDAKMEKLADNGNGLYAYIDSVREARKVLVEQLTGSTITIAKDVKIQIEFNPHEIAAYRLIGYENRVLAAEDFNDDKKDAGEIGAGHTVTALYELVPVGATSEGPAEPKDVEPLRYQRTEDGGQRTEDGARGAGTIGNARRGVPGAATLTDAATSGELLTLKLRYKEPDGDESQLREYPVKDRGGKFNSASGDMQFASAVASFGMILRNSEHKGSGNLAAVAEIAGSSLGDDPGGYRAEFVDLVRKAQALGAR
jgi:Ca-activated chloride channel family protein